MPSPKRHLQRLQSFSISGKPECLDDGSRRHVGTDQKTYARIHLTLRFPYLLSHSAAPSRGCTLPSIPWLSISVNFYGDDTTGSPRKLHSIPCHDHPCCRITMFSAAQVITLSPETEYRCHPRIYVIPAAVLDFGPLAVSHTATPVRLR
jgi:hypothetical protein